MKISRPDYLARFAILIAAASLLGACEPPAERGNRETQQRQVTSFERIDIRGAGKMRIQVGSPASVSITGDDRVLARITTEVHGNTLVINRNRDWYWLDDNNGLTISISLPKLEELRLQGAGDVQLTGLNGGSSTVSFSGAGHIQAEGKLDDLTVSMNGAGHGDFSKVEAKNAKVTISGAGSIFVHPIDALDATLNGVGSIEYDGNPTKVSSSIHGVGSIGQRSEHRHRHRKHRHRNKDDDDDKDDDKQDAGADDAVEL